VADSISPSGPQAVHADPLEMFRVVSPGGSAQWLDTVFTISRDCFEGRWPGYLPIDALLHLTNIGTLFAFVVVSVAVPVLRAKRPEAKRPFKVPGGPVVPVLGALSGLYLMLSLSVMTWVRFLVWLDVGMLIYWFYGRTHSTLVDRTEAARRTGAQAFANLATIVGALVTFNGLAIAVLGFLTTWGVTTEVQAKWSELDTLLGYAGMHITAEIADTYGLAILGIGIVLLAIGMVLRRMTGAPAAAAPRV